MKNLQELFVPYELALKLKEKGFNEPCLATYPTENYSVFIKGELLFSSITNTDNRCHAPLYQQVVDWLRLKHDMFIFIETDIIHGTEIHFGKILGKYKPIEVFSKSGDYYDTYNKLIEQSLNMI